jgi:SHAQKYF class myb-like DNA-binding protein
MMNSLVMMRAGQPWTSEEHLQFLAGLKKLGRSNWRGISRYFVPTRTPTQVKRLQQATQLFPACSSPKRGSRHQPLKVFLLDPAVL